MSHIFDNHGNKVEYIPGLKVGDLLRAKKTVFSKGDSADLRSTFDYTAFKPGELYTVDRLYVWDGHTIGYVRDGDNTLWFAETNVFERA